MYYYYNDLPPIIKILIVIGYELAIGALLLGILEYLLPTSLIWTFPDIEKDINFAIYFRPFIEEIGKVAILWMIVYDKKEALIYGSIAGAVFGIWEGLARLITYECFGFMALSLHIITAIMGAMLIAILRDWRIEFLGKFRYIMWIVLMFIGPVLFHIAFNSLFPNLEIFCYKDTEFANKTSNLLLMFLNLFRF